MRIVNVLSTISMILLSTSIYVSGQECSRASGTSNRYYMQVKAIDLDDNVCAMTSGSVRGVNVLDEFCPTCPEHWDHRTIYVSESATTFICTSWEKAECNQVDSPWYQNVNVNDYVVLDYVFKYNLEDGSKARITNVIYVVEAIR